MPPDAQLQLTIASTTASQAAGLKCQDRICAGVSSVRVPCSPPRPAVAAFKKCMRLIVQQPSCSGRLRSAPNRLRDPSKLIARSSSSKVVGKGLLWELNPGPLAPKVRIIPPDQAASGRVCIPFVYQLFAPANHKCRDPGSNRGPSDLQSDALPTEPSRLHWGQFDI